ncbi:uncharacterized protein LOC132717342, partial [Ruditapes philippinarum]|uniref:uncharacterized protein LOC132717342 n=1 Tax=Ruditapes philippinarum TaxID=129788 RepID=UPI00295B1F68
MRTRSDIKRTSKSSDSKISLSKNNQKIQNSSSTPRNQKKTQLVKSSSTTPPAVQSEAGVRNGKLLSPRRRALVQTPGRDDVICSQHFDSQMVVGWDCNSPDTLRGIKRISGPGHDDVSDLVMTLIGEEADDEVFTKRNTPPLLGVWKDDSEDKLLDNNNVVVSHRLRRNRGRQRRKSGKESAVSKDLLSKLTLALDKCSEAEEQQSEGEGELLLIGEDGTSKQLNCSDDLFNSESNDNVDVKFTT